MVLIHLKTEDLLEFYHFQLYEVIQIKEYYQARNKLLVIAADYNLYEEIHWHTILQELKYRIREAISHTADKIYALGYFTPHGR